jgi:2-oxoglutarate ferredoxin oxidoreductase subunit alpha
MKGNEALAEAAIRAGCKCFFGYPITPQTELSAYMAKKMQKAGGVFLQAELLPSTWFWGQPQLAYEQ